MDNYWIVANHFWESWKINGEEESLLYWISVLFMFNTDLQSRYLWTIRVCIQFHLCYQGKLTMSCKFIQCLLKKNKTCKRHWCTICTEINMWFFMNAVFSTCVTLNFPYTVAITTGETLNFPYTVAILLCFYFSQNKYTQHKQCIRPGAQ